MSDKRDERVQDKRRSDALKERFRLLISQLRADIRDIRIMLQYLDVNVDDELDELDKEISIILDDVRKSKRDRGH